MRLAILVMLAFLMTGCSDDMEVLVLPVENKTLAVTDTVCMIFKSMNGSSEGGIEGVEMSKYREMHLEMMNNGIFNFDYLVEESSLTFIGETDSVKISGYISCGYIYYPYETCYAMYANEKVFKYKFEDNTLKILPYPDYKDYWVVLGYGDKEKIEVYIETKYFYRGVTPNEPGVENKYFWEIPGTFFGANISIDPEQASAVVRNQNWQDFFDEVNVNWINIPVGKKYTEFKSSQDMKHKYQGATWSVYKMTYLPKMAKKY